MATIAKPKGNKQLQCYKNERLSSWVARLAMYVHSVFLSSLPYPVMAWNRFPSWGCQPSLLKTVAIFILPMAQGSLKRIKWLFTSLVFKQHPQKCNGRAVSAPCHPAWLSVLETSFLLSIWKEDQDFILIWQVLEGTRGQLGSAMTNQRAYLAGLTP